MIVAQAIMYLSNSMGMNNIYHFKDRNIFLMCSVIFDQAIKIIDVIDRYSYSDAGWLAGTLDKRKIKKTHYIAQKSRFYHHDIRKDVIVDVQELTKLLAKLKRQKPLTITEAIERKLPPTYFDFVIEDALKPEKKGCTQTMREYTSYIGIKYRVRQKLNIKNRIQYEILLGLIREDINKFAV